MTKVKFNKHDYENGIEMEIYVDFIDNKDGTMKILQCSISRGIECVDYANVLEKYTLLDIIKEFMHE